MHKQTDEQTDRQKERHTDTSKTMRASLNVAGARITLLIIVLDPRQLVPTSQQSRVYSYVPSCRSTPVARTSGDSPFGACRLINGAADRAERRITK